MTVEERRRRRFTDDFRKDQVRLIESGKLTILEVSKLYEVKTNNVRKWIKKFGSKPLPGTIIVSNGSEYGRLKALEKQSKQLHETIGQQQVEILYLRALLEQAKERMGDDFEKK